MQRSLDVFPENIGLANLLSDLFLQSGAPQKAVEVYAPYNLAEVKNLMAYRRFVKALIALRQTGQAAQILQAALIDFPDDPVLKTQSQAVVELN